MWVLCATTWGKSWSTDRCGGSRISTAVQQPCCPPPPTPPPPYYRPHIPRSPSRGHDGGAFSGQLPVERRKQFDTGIRQHGEWSESTSTDNTFPHSPFPSPDSTLPTAEGGMGEECHFAVTLLTFQSLKSYVENQGISFALRSG